MAHPEVVLEGYLRVYIWVSGTSTGSGNWWCRQMDEHNASGFNEHIWYEEM